MVAFELLEKEWLIMILEQMAKYLGGKCTILAHIYIFS